MDVDQHNGTSILLFPPQIVSIVLVKANSWHALSLSLVWLKALKFILLVSGCRSTCRVHGPLSDLRVCTAICPLICNRILLGVLFVGWLLQGTASTCT